MGVTCQIFIRRPREGVHKAGGLVIGKVKYAIDKPTEYSSIILSFVGKGICSWEETKQTSKKRERRIYTGTEVYTEQYISMHDSTVPKIYLLSGVYEYPFTFKLPKNIPPSFENDVCRIRYKLVLKFTKPKLFSLGTRFDTVINVYSHVQPTSQEGSLIFGLQKTLFKPFNKRTHQVDLKVDISNTIFSPGQNAELKYIVTNDADVTIPSVKTELICYTTYTANCGKKKQKHETIRECTLETPSVPSNAVANMANTMPILAHLYSIQHCSIMVKEYAVKVTVRLPLPYINASAKIPIVIGEKDSGIDVQRTVEEIEDEPPSYLEAIMGGFSNDNDWDASSSADVVSFKR